MDNLMKSPERIKRITSTFFYSIFLFALPLSGCEGAEPIPPNVIRLEGDYVPGGGLTPDIFWLDEHRVIFEGLGGVRPRTAEEAKKGTHGIYIWDTRSSTVELYRAQAQALCFYDGFIRYQIARDENGEFLQPEVRKIYAGRFGKEELQASANDSDVMYSPFTCERQEKSRDAFGNLMVPLGHGHGFRRFSPDAVEIIGPRANPVGVISQRSSYQYLPWINSYFFWEALTSSDEVSHSAMFRLPSRFVTRDFKLPLRGTARSVVVMHDTLLLEVDDTSRGGQNQSGLYFLNPSNMEVSELRSGSTFLAWHPSRGVSGDGCKLAYAYSETLREAGFWGGMKKYLEVIDICHEGRKG